MGFCGQAIQLGPGPNARPAGEVAGRHRNTIVREVIKIEQLQPRALAYDTTNFYTDISASTTRPELPQRGHNKQGRHDLRQLGMCLWWWTRTRNCP